MRILMPGTKTDPANNVVVDHSKIRSIMARALDASTPSPILEIGNHHDAHYELAHSLAPIGGDDGCKETR